MSALRFSSPPAFPFTLQEALSTGASYSDKTIERLTLVESVHKLEQFCDKSMGRKRGLNVSGPTLTPSMNKGR